MEDRDRRIIGKLSGQLELSQTAAETRHKIGSASNKGNKKLLPLILVLGIEPRASHMLHKHSADQLLLLALPCAF